MSRPRFIATAATIRSPSRSKVMKLVHGDAVVANDAGVASQLDVRLDTDAYDHDVGRVEPTGRPNHAVAGDLFDTFSEAQINTVTPMYARVELAELRSEDTSER